MSGKKKNFSEHISFEEYACKCCKRLPPDFKIDAIPNVFLEFFNAFEQLRKKWEKPISIVSGYRCVQHNRRIGGAPLSAHLFGLALDLLFETNEDAEKFRALVDAVTPELRMGKYNKHPRLVHIDTAYLIFPRAHRAWAKGKRFENV